MREQWTGSGFLLAGIGSAAGLLDSSLDRRWGKLWLFCLRYIGPLVILTIFFAA
jgi:SNF family Na+-dependent transporter